MQNKQNKQAESKQQYGTLTAKLDANNDYASSTAGTSATGSATSADTNQLGKLAKQSQAGSATSAATSSKSQKANQTLTAKYDANGDYSAE
ncbi:hypothetical protein [Sporomusa termitida]|uniref:Uncharacterized protein n=1 Tax=Sporomusa termitida TaxID=2377 RepID=A0A517DSM0_9FIRM|nr:hypothetical protein [Sporomusa termitida]QDR80350.1 hypothetical protein SPTER_16730 [Sporomusa termitida]